MKWWHPLVIGAAIAAVVICLANVPPFKSYDCPKGMVMIFASHMKRAVCVAGIYPDEVNK